MTDITNDSGDAEARRDIEHRLRDLKNVVDGSRPGTVEIGRAGESAGVVDISWTSVDSPVGPIVVAATDIGLLRLSFDGPDETLDHLAAQVSPRVVEGGIRVDPACRELEQYFAGDRRSFDLALDTRLSRGFRADVLRHLREVRYGSTVTYAELAALAGSPRATRAVGSSMATNPIPIVVPCHRVLRSDGTLGGYAGGLDAKEWLLGLEQVEVPRR